MKLEDDFVSDETIEINIDGRMFLFKPTSGGDENAWLKDIMYVNDDKKQVVDWGVYNLKKLSHIIKVPYSDETIEKVIKIKKTWSELNSEERCSFLNKLKPGIYDKLITAIREIDEPDEKSIKN